MKIIVFQGGLGNQIFQYAFYRFQKKNYPQLKWIFASGNSHNGFELNKWFDVEMVHANFLWRIIFRIVHFLKVKGIHDYIIDADANPEKNGIFISGYWQNKKYYQKHFLNFKKLKLSSQNEDIKKRMQSTQSIAIHIRRGDYLQPPYDKIYSGICTIEYYQHAIQIIKMHFDNPQFFIFSDDIEWVKENLKIPNSIFIDWNKGHNSIYDMYLMSHTKANIIANSTFSYWGAFLNSKTEMVIYPKKWFNSQYSTPDIFPKTWLGI
jgi:hypothetical protein